MFGFVLIALESMPTQIERYTICFKYYKIIIINSSNQTFPEGYRAASGNNSTTDLRLKGYT